MIIILVNTVTEDTDLHDEIRLI